MNDYQTKFVTPEQAVKAVQSGDWVDYGFGAGFPELLDRALATINRSVDSFCSHVIVGTPYAVKALARRNCGLAFLYESSAKEELAAGTLRQVRIRHFNPQYRFTFLWKSGSMYKEDFLRMYRRLVGNQVPDMSVKTIL